MVFTFGLEEVHLFEVRLLHHDAPGLCMQRSDLAVKVFCFHIVDAGSSRKTTCTHRVLALLDHVLLAEHLPLAHDAHPQLLRSSVIQTKAVPYGFG